MAETKLTAKQLKSQIAALLNKKAKETDEVEKAKLKKEIDRLNAQLKEINKQESEQKNLSVVEKAKKELERLNKLDPGTPGVAPAKAEQEKIIADATKKGLPKPTPKPGVTEKPIVEEKPKVITKPTIGSVPTKPTGLTTPLHNKAGC
jgi:TolA-binding protein